jgi:uncharacterized protein (DUF4415 family)
MRSESFQHEKQQSRRGGHIMIIRKDIDLDKPLTEEQKNMLEVLKKRADDFDEDSPELSLEELEQFRRIAEQRREERRKQTVTIRLSPQTLMKAKALGKGYTSVLSRIIEIALDDSELIRKCL